MYTGDRKAFSGLFKDEFVSKVMRQFVALRSKMASMEIQDDKRKFAAAGIKNSIASKKLLHKNFKDVLFEGLLDKKVIIYIQ